MPCFSKMQTVLIDLPTIEKAAEALGFKVEKRTANSFTLRKGNEYITIEREKEGGKFSTKPYSGSNNWPDEILAPLIKSYARETIKTYYKSKGYTMSAGATQDELVFTSYK